MYKDVIIKLPRKERQRLNKLALAYGLSLEELGQRVLAAVADSFPEEKLSEYKKPDELHASLDRALRDFQVGRVYQTLE